MRFVERDENGKITGHYATPQPGRAEEPMEENDPALVAYSTPPVDLVVAMDQVMNALPMPLQVQFAPLMASGKLFIETGRLDRLQALIELTPVPEELAEAKAQLLALIPTP